MISVKDFQKDRVGKYRTGVAEVLYWDMTLFCDVVITKARDKVWVKIPQTYDIKAKKNVNILKWCSREISDAFQEEVKKELAEKFSEALIIPEKRIARKNDKKRARIAKRFFSNNNSNEKNSKHDSQKDFKPNPNIPVTPGKARSQSVFSTKRS